MSPEDRFHSMPRDAAGHLALHVYATQVALTSYLTRLANEHGEARSETLDQFPFLQTAIEEFRRFMPPEVTWFEAPAWWRDALLEWEGRGDPDVNEHFPLRAIARMTGAGFSARLAWILTALVEEDVRFGSVFASLQNPVAARRPCVALLTEMLAGLDETDPVEPWLVSDLMRVEDERVPRAEWTLRVELRAWNIVGGGGVPPLEQDSSTGRSVGERLWRRAVAPPWEAALAEIVEPGALRNLPQLLARDEAPIVLLRGSGGSGRRRLLASAAAECGRDLIEVAIEAGQATSERLRSIGIEAALRGAVPAVVADLGPGEALDIASLAARAGPLCVVLGREGGLAGNLQREVLTLDMPRTTQAARASIWLEELGDALGELDPQLLARTVTLPREHARRAARGAREAARIAGRSEVTVPDLRVAARALGPPELDRLAQRVPARGGWDDLVTSPQARRELELVEQRCTLGTDVSEGLGVAFRNVESRGQKLLVHGPSGVGKSLAVRILAARLGRDLHVADLGALHDKWVGESEKAVSRLLAAAEERDVVLLIDEGDSLLAPRTAVHGASEKFSNLLTNHFLTRLESYEGVLAVTTNALDRTDVAFARRFDAIISLGRPDALQREQIFSLHLPEACSLTAQERSSLARRAVLTGGQIRNAVLHAAQLAVTYGRAGAPSADDLEAGVRRELRKAGRPEAPRQETRRGNAFLFTAEASTARDS